MFHRWKVPQFPFQPPPMQLLNIFSLSFPRFRWLWSLSEDRCSLFDKWLSFLSGESSFFVKGESVYLSPVFLLFEATTWRHCWRMDRSVSDTSFPNISKVGTYPHYYSCFSWGRYPSWTSWISPIGWKCPVSQNGCDLGLFVVVGTGVWRLFRWWC